MSLHSLQTSCYILLFSSVLWTALLRPSSAVAQGPGPGVGAGENPWSDNSRTPFEVQMSGVISPETEGDEGIEGESIAVVTLGIAQFHETYKFEIIKVESPANPQLSTSQILQKKGKRQYDFELIGPAALLSKVAQSQPGTPLKIVGMYEQRNQRLQLLNVDIIGMDKY